MRHRSRAVQVLGSGALLGAAACFSLSRTSPPLEEFVLGGTNTTGATLRAAPRITNDSTGLTIGVRRVDLAPYLATPAIVVRRGGRIVTSEFHRWGEDPAAGVTRAVSEYLGAMPSVFAVDVAPWPVRSRHDYLVQLHISRMEGVVADQSGATQGELHIMAAWEVMRPDDGAVLARGESDRRESGWTVGDYRGFVVLLEKGLNGVAGDVAACVVRLKPAVPVLDSAKVTRTVLCGRT
jgi:uncharacterized lipoprotein YmbA